MWLHILYTFLYIFLCVCEASPLPHSHLALFKNSISEGIIIENFVIDHFLRLSCRYKGARAILSSGKEEKNYPT